MLALLKLIPFKDWVYGGIIAALLVGFGVYTHHERVIGATKEAGAVTKVAVKAEAKVTAANVAAQTTETTNAKTYDQTIAAPPVLDLSVVCQRTYASSDHVSQAGSVAASGAGEQSVEHPSGPAFDPSGPLLERARIADAQVTYLQGRVHELEKQMVNSP